MEEASEIERYLKTDDGIKVHWYINPIPTNTKQTEQAIYYKLILSIMEKGSSHWDGPHEYFPRIEEVSTAGANGQFRIDVDKVQKYLFHATISQEFAVNWRMTLFGP